MILLLIGCTGESPADSGELKQDSAVEITHSYFQGELPCREPATGEVVRVYDGDTITVRVADREERVRMIGIDSAEVSYDGDPSECWADAAKQHLFATLIGQSVGLGFAHECEDAYERTLAYVSMGEVFVNHAMVSEGWATVFPVAPNISYQGLFETAEAEALAGGLGIWGNCGR